MRKRIDRSQIILFTLCIIGFLLRLKILSSTTLILYSDSSIYMDMARRFYEGNYISIIHPHWSPLYPFFSFLFFLFLRDWVITPYIVSIFFGSILIYPVYQITLNLFGKKEAFFAAVLTTFYYPLLTASTKALTESLYIFFFWLGISFLIQSFKTNTKNFSLIAGICWGLACLTKSDGLAAIVSLSFFFVIYLITALIKIVFKSKDKINIHFFLVKTLTFFIGFLILYMPYKLVLKRMYPNLPPFAKNVAHITLRSPFTLNKENTSTWAQDIWSLDTFNQNSEIFKGVKKLFIFSHLKIMYSDMITRAGIILSFYQKECFGFAVGLLGVLGVLRLFIERRKLIYGVFFTVFFLVLFLLVMFLIPSVNYRYGYFLLPLYAIFPPGALFFLLKFLKGNSKKLFLVMILIFSIYAFRKAVDSVSVSELLPLSFHFEETTMSITSRWIAENYPHSAIMARHEGICFYNKGQIVYSPNVSNLQELIDYGKLWNVDIVVASPGEVFVNLKFLYEEPKNYPGLKMISASKNEYVLYLLK